MNALDRVARAEQRLAHARRSLDKNIAEAHRDGFSLRQIAEAARLSHSQINRIINSTTTTEDATS